MLALGLVAAPAPALAMDFYVAPTGDDANPGTEAKPFATMARGQMAASPGDTVYLRGGTYAFVNATASDGIDLTNITTWGRGSSSCTARTTSSRTVIRITTSIRRSSGAQTSSSGGVVPGATATGGAGNTSESSGCQCGVVGMFGGDTAGGIACVMALLSLLARRRRSNDVSVTASSSAGR